MIFHNKPTIGKEETSAVSRALKSGWLAQGREVEQFEKELCRFLNESQGEAAVFSSGTAALYVALLSLGIGPGDKIMVPSYVCSALLNAVYFIRAEPILVDVNYDDLNISFSEVQEKMSKEIKAIIIPHIFGMPADVNKFLKLGIPIIEDCAQAIGAKLNGKHLGTFGKVAIFSFYASKLLTTGYGGMVFSKNKKLIEKIRDYREFDCRKEYKPRFNFQMSDLQAAIGRAQLKKLPLFLKKRKRIASEYYKILPPEKVWPPRNTGNKMSNFYRFLIRTDKAKKMKDFLEKRGIKTIIPIETYELLHRYLGQNPHNFPISEKVAKTTLSLPIYPSLTNLEIKKIKSALKEYFSQK